MTPLARIVAVIAGLALLLLAGAAAVRQAALAGDGGISWPVAAWWKDLTAQASTATVVAAAGVCAVAALLLFLAWRQWSPRVPRQIIEYKVPDGTARLSVPALRKALRKRFESMLPGSRCGEMSVSRDADGWGIRLEAAVPTTDLGDVHDAVLRAFRDDMSKVAGIHISRLDLVVTSMRPAPKQPAPGKS